MWRGDRDGRRIPLLVARVGSVFKKGQCAHRRDCVAALLRKGNGDDPLGRWVKGTLACGGRAGGSETLGGRTPDRARQHEHGSDWLRPPCFIPEHQPDIKSALQSPQPHGPHAPTPRAHPSLCISVFLRYLNMRDRNHGMHSHKATALSYDTPPTQRPHRHRRRIFYLW
jgi:hypothetical protein